jgi:hypothetical protein
MERTSAASSQRQHRKLVKERQTIVDPVGNAQQVLIEALRDPKNLSPQQFKEAKEAYYLLSRILQERKNERIIREWFGDDDAEGGVVETMKTLRKDAGKVWGRRK